MVLEDAIAAEKAEYRTVDLLSDRRLASAEYTIIVYAFTVPVLKFASYDAST